MYPVIILLIMLSSLFLPAQSSAEKGSPAAELIEQELLLQAEFQAAKTTKPYFTFNLRNRKIELKIRGMVLKEWQINRIRFWGDPVAIKAIALLGKTTLFPPDRPVIRPIPKNQDTSTTFDSLDPGDMPDHYTLFLENNIYLHIRPKTRGIASAIAGVGNAIEWFLSPPLRSIRGAVTGKPYTAISLTMGNRDETKLLYWAFLEGMQALLLPDRHFLRPPAINERLPGR